MCPAIAQVMTCRCSKTKTKAWGYWVLHTAALSAKDIVSDTSTLTHHLEQITDSSLLCLWKLRMNGRLHTEFGGCDAAGGVMEVIDEQMLKIAMDPDRYR